MVNRRIVEPIRYLNLPIFFVQEGRRHWEAGVRVEWWKILPVDVIAIIKWLSVPVQVRLGKFVLIVVDPILRLDNVRSVVDHNVEDRPYPATFCLRDQVLEIFLRSEVRINVGKVQNPITMIPRSRRSPRTIVLHRTIAKDRTHPDRCRPEVAKIIELRRNSLQITSMEKIRVRRIESALVWIGRRRPSNVIGGITVIEPIRQEKIDNLPQPWRSNTRLKKTILSMADRTT